MLCILSKRTRPLMLRCLYLVLVMAVHQALFAFGAQAGDGAALNVLGFSADGRYFAFEQYGMQDGSGFPYAEIAVIDTQSRTGNDTPYMLFRETIEDETAEQAAVRDSIGKRAQPILAALGIHRRGMVVALDEVTRPFEALLPMEVHQTLGLQADELRIVEPTRGATVALRLKQWKMSSPRCATAAPARTNAFAIELSREGGPSQEIHVDRDLPDSRNCPYVYGLVGTYLHAQQSGGSVIAVVVSYYPVGFEGPDRRFLTVTAGVK